MTTNTMQVPFVDLRSQHRALQAELGEAIDAVMERADFALGKDVPAFEQEFAAFTGTQYAVGVDSGLSALEMALRALGVGAGDEVIVPANTFIATAAAATFAGAEPVLVDVDPGSYNIDVNRLEEAITPRTRAIIPVHLYGQPADMDPIMEIAERHGLVVVEDACQAHGALYKGRRVGSLGHAAAFSFYPTKNLGAAGDAGILTTNDPQVDEMVRALRNVGQRSKYVHDLAPFNHRLDTLQASILRVKLRYLDGWNEARRNNAAVYDQLLNDDNAPEGIIAPAASLDSTHVYHLYVVRVPNSEHPDTPAQGGAPSRGLSTFNRDRMKAFLAERGIGTAIHYPVPIHRQPFYADKPFSKQRFPVTEMLADEILSLPMFPEMTGDQARYVIDQIREYSEEARQYSEQIRESLQAEGTRELEAAPQLAA